MEAKMVHWQRYCYDEHGFRLLEVFENGRVMVRHFVKREDEFHLYKETRREDFHVQGNIEVEKVDFGNDGKLHEKELLKHVETIRQYPLEEWTEARTHVLRLQDESASHLSHDYHSLLHLDEDSLSNELKDTLTRRHFPIVKFRFENKGGMLFREEYPERLEIRFGPELNERLYFYLHTRQQHLTTTGDNLFALHTKHCAADFCETDYEGYIDAMIEEVRNHPRRYHDLITKQRDRRAMIETDETGDLYPR